MAVKAPDSYKTHHKTKRLATLEHLIFEVIPSDPANKLWLLGNTMGSEHRAWRRAKFMQQYRLFFRFDSKAKILVYAWVNDQESLRARESQRDAYLVFKRMMAGGNPPTTWAELVAASASLTSF